MLASFGNLLDAAAGDRHQEIVDCVLDTPNLKIERIVSMGQRSPPGFWYDQPLAEWIVVLAGSAGLSFEGEAETRALSAGDYLLIPAHVKHRVEWTSEERATIWLAIHFPENKPEPED